MHPWSAAAPSGSWTSYHFDHAHTGYDPSQPAASGAAAGWTSPALNGEIYGEPLVYNGLVYVATLQNVVYALHQTDGTIAWSQTLPAPQTGGWSCGNINPTGILGTGIIDPTANRIYFAPFLHQFLAYYLYAFDLTTGTIVMTTDITPPNAGFDWTIQQQRGALALSTDRSHVYVPFGGRIGDCGPYHGWVVGVPTNGTAVDEVYETPSTGSGSWAAGGVAVDDTTGNVFFSTGNAIPCVAQVSDSVIRTNATLGSPAQFQPPDWDQHWCSTDTDLGSVGPMLIGSNLIFQTGKYGQGFLINSSTMAQAYPSPSPYTGVDVCAGTNGDASFGAEAYANGRVYLTCEGHGVVSLTVDTAAPSFSSCDSSCNAAGTWLAAVGTVGPPIVAGGIVWAVGTGTPGSGLWGFDANTGAQIYHSSGFNANRFVTPSEAGGQIFVPAGTVVKSFDMVLGCNSVTLSAAPATSAQAATTVVLTGAASGPNCASPQYQFWMRPAAGGWSMLQDYTSSATYNWTTTTPPGDYFLGVHARHAGSTAAFESLASIPYTLTPVSCSAVALGAAPASPQLASTPVTFTATGTCPNANPLFAFWARWQGYNTWQLLQGYSTSNVYHWNSTGAAAGTEYIGVWVKDAGSSTSDFDRNLSIQYSVTTGSCASVTISAAPTSVVHGSGTHSTITAAAAGCASANPLYEFWLRTTTSGWQLIRGWSTTATYDWNSTGAPVTTVYFGVWVKDASSATTTFDANASTPVSVT